MTGEELAVKNLEKALERLRAVEDRLSKMETGVQLCEERLRDEASQAFDRCDYDKCDLLRKHADGLQKLRRYQTETVVSRAERAIAAMTRDFRCAECGKLMTDHVYVTRCGGCGESYTGPPISFLMGDDDDD